MLDQGGKLLGLFLQLQLACRLPCDIDRDAERACHAARAIQQSDAMGGVVARFTRRVEDKQLAVRGRARRRDFVVFLQRLLGQLQRKQIEICHVDDIDLLAAGLELAHFSKRAIHHHITMAGVFHPRRIRHGFEEAA